MFKQYITGPAEAAVKVRVTQSNSTNLYHVGPLKSYFAIFQFLLKRVVTDDNTAKLNVELYNLRQGSTRSTEFLHELWTKTFRCGSVYDEKCLKTLFLEAVTHSICKTLCNL